MLIAIIEDERDILDLLSLHLKKAGFNIKGFQKGIDFFNYLKNEIPDLVIIDLMLPDIDGLEICKYLKKETKYSNIPIIILTAKGEELDRVLELELGLKSENLLTKKLFYTLVKQEIEHLEAIEKFIISGIHTLKSETRVEEEIKNYFLI